MEREELFLLVQYNNWDKGSNTMIFDSQTKLAYWIKQTIDASLRYTVIQLCKRHINYNKCHAVKYGKCCKIIQEG